MKYICKECGQEFNSSLSLSRHISQKHGKVEYYYNKFILPKQVCIECNKGEVSFIGLEKGYKRFCSPSCSTTFSRRELKKNHEKEEQFKSRLSAAVKHEWATKDQSKRIHNMKTTIQFVSSSLTNEEKRDKFGWMNKLSEDEKEVAVQKILQTGCHLWWKSATEEEKLEVFEKRAKTLRITWDLHGKEIMFKSIETFLKNKEAIQSDDLTLSEDTNYAMSVAFEII